MMMLYEEMTVSEHQNCSAYGSLTGGIDWMILEGQQQQKQQNL